MDDPSPQLARISKLPAYLSERYHGWRATDHQENKAWYRRLAEEGQRPRTMVISCSDSRVHVTNLFGAHPGEFFMHRNVANLVPPFEPDGQHHGTSAAIEYAVTALKVSNLIIMGHSFCGGAAGCTEMCRGHAPELDIKESMLGRWLDVLRPGYERVKGVEDGDAHRIAMEKQTVVVSLENLMSFPFVQKAVEDELLAVHGLYMDIASGQLSQFEPATGEFSAI
ncbi:carbonic anhydrase [Poseidonocella sp. HB161398]|uniref:carbonic anhydrase n=1 Tax=Poseidonocella sp. HB161398 TaxID=2320855 RepID=UPI001108F663|nr:carbonic anhydrase [Poseidonocella sp. HB161398]